MNRLLSRAARWAAYRVLDWLREPIEAMITHRLLLFYERLLRHEQIPQPRNLYERLPTGS